MLTTKPMSKKYVFHYLNDTQYKRYARGYSIGKRNGVRGIYLWATGIKLSFIYKINFKCKLIKNMVTFA